MLEREIEAKLRRWCKKEGIVCYKFTSPAHRGVPDRVLIANGRTVFLEIKAEGKKPTKLQLREIERINLAGGRADWADGWNNVKSKTLEMLYK